MGVLCFCKGELRSWTPTVFCSTATQPSLPICTTFRCAVLKTCLPSEWHWKYDNCRPTSSPPLLTRRIGTTSSPVCLLAWAKLCPCCSQASSFHRVIFFGHVPITTCSFKVRRRWLLRHSPPLSYSWRPTVKSLDFQLLSETRYCEMDLVMCTTSVALPPTVSFLILSTSQQIWRGSCWSVHLCS